ncbi:hypothetical protein L198_04299 [Cryptococcus wingfieldii CBS 7118]|uniref:F-box domain-containing protein n=1 Tax=Cryptococcus wingfieldii CBS 7118 TaxID=1295528 RepID=A0A1E3J6U2_9TREE|nr:hypothetical protein L198_04299 [Cryptococcus wingfieldii CBS 7118]ODN96583.1 hypothetical protein L198_04299 [Cryptococcus wingfieldii CBS 7118]
MDPTPHNNESRDINPFRRALRHPPPHVPREPSTSSPQHMPVFPSPEYPENLLRDWSWDWEDTMSPDSNPHMSSHSDETSHEVDSIVRQQSKLECMLLTALDDLYVAQMFEDLLCQPPSPRSEHRPTRSLLGLPNELLMMTFNCLPVEQIVSLRSTCKLFAELTKSRALYRSVLVDQFPWASDDLQGVSVPRFYTEYILPHIRHLTVILPDNGLNTIPHRGMFQAMDCQDGVCTPSFIYTFLDSIPCHQLETLIFPRSGFLVILDIWAKLLAQQRHLRTVNLSGACLDTDCMELLSAMNRLEHLDLSGVLAVDGWEDLTEAFVHSEAWKAIRYMDLSACVNIDKVVFKEFLKSLPVSLRYLDLSALPWVDSSMLEGVKVWGRRDGDGVREGPVQLRWIGLKGTKVSEVDLCTLNSQWAKSKLQGMESLSQRAIKALQLNKQEIVDQYNLELLQVDHAFTPSFNRAHSAYDIHHGRRDIGHCLSKISALIECQEHIQSYVILEGFTEEAEQMIRSRVEDDATRYLRVWSDRGVVLNWRYERWNYACRLGEFLSNVAKVD